MILGDLLNRRLAGLGVRRVWGEAVPASSAPGPRAAAGVGAGATNGAGRDGTPVHVPVGEADLAVLMADADGRIGEVDGRGRLGAALLPDGVLHLSSRPGGTAHPRTVTTPAEVLDALVDPPGILTPGASALHLDVDLSTPVDDDVVATAQPERSAVVTLDRSLAAMEIVVVVGPGVVRAAGVSGLHDFTRAAGAGVLNTRGSKGVERWDSPWHFGTVGLQERDLELAGVSGADMVVVSGLDPHELSVHAIGHPLTQEVHPAQLGALCLRWDAPGSEPAKRPPLYEELARVMTPAYEDDSAPLSGARASLHLSGALPEGAMAVVDPGAAGFWVARTFPTSIPNSVCVPAEADPGGAAGFAAAAALVCRLEGRPVLAVTDEPGFDAPETAAVLAFAEDRELPVALQVWRDEPAGVKGWSSAGDHVELLSAHLGADRVSVDDVPVRLGDTAALESVAGAPVPMT